MQRSMLRRTLLAVALIALLPVPIVRAADVQPVVTMDPIATSVYRGDQETFVAHISDGAPNGVTFEWSPDGTTWNPYAGSNQSGGDPFEWRHSGYVDGNLPLGSSYIRAHYPGSAGYLPADSAPQAREVKIRQAQITEFRAYNPDGVILPSTDTARLAYTGSHAAKLYKLVDGNWQLFTQCGSTCWGLIGPLGEGDSSFRAEIEETEYYLGASQELTVHVAKAASEPVWGGDLTVQANHPLLAQMTVTGPYGNVSYEAPMTVKDVATDTVIATGNVGTEFTIPGMSAGTHAFLMTYAGNADYESSSKTFNIVVTPDSADATGVGTNYTTFYPYKDGYRDTVTIRGNRLEPLSVWIRIYSSTGSLVKSVTLARAAGTYGYAWNGRTSSGAIRAAGKYKVVQVLADASGARKTFTSYVNLSHKRLVTKTAYITKLGSSISAKGDPGTGSITISTSSGYARLTGRYPNGWVGVGYQFTVPSATVYKSIAFQVYSKGPQSVPPAEIGLQNFVICPYSSSGDWYESCFDHWKLIGSAPVGPIWHSTSGSASANRHSRIVRGMVSVPYSTQTIYRARVKVVYGVLQ